MDLADAPDIAPPSHSGSIVIARPPEAVYAVVSDITRMGDFSPVCKACWWDEGHGPEVGSWFTGRNETPERTWETHCQVVAATPGREFAWVVGDVEGGYVRWTYSFAPVEAGTELTESWQVQPPLMARFAEHADTPEQFVQLVAERTQITEQGIAATLAAIKRAAESTEG